MNTFFNMLPFVIILGAPLGTYLAILAIRRRIQRQIEGAIDYQEGDVATDQLVENENTIVAEDGSTYAAK